MPVRKYIHCRVHWHDPSRQVLNNPLTMSELHLTKQWLNDTNVKKVEMNLETCSQERYKLIFG